MLESPLDTAATTVTTDDIVNNGDVEDDASSELYALATDSIGNEDDSATTAA